jgi:hypothetical protein
VVQSIFHFAHIGSQIHLLILIGDQIARFGSATYAPNSADAMPIRLDPSNAHRRRVGDSLK